MAKRQQPYTVHFNVRYIKYLFNIQINTVEFNFIFIVIC